MSIREKCQKLWIKAATGEDDELQFNTNSERERARFAIYDSCRKTNDQEILRARELVEVIKGKGDLTLRLSLKTKNPYHKNLDQQLESLIGEESSIEVAISPEESLRRFQEKLEKAPEVRPGTPYFNRGEE